VLGFWEEANSKNAIKVLPDPLTDSKEIVVVVVASHGGLMFTPMVLVGLPEP